MSDPIPFNEVARLPAPGDNAAIALRELEEGTKIDYEGATIELPHTVLIGHRFAVKPIHKDEFITSWESPYGKASTEINPGDLIRNEAGLTALKSMVDITLPRTHNMVDDVPPYEFKEDEFQKPTRPEPINDGLTFDGYLREGNRGTGTRNNIVLLGTSASTGGFVKQLETKVKGLASDYDNVDDIVALAHTEGSDDEITDEHKERVLKTLAGLAINPNVGGIVIVGREDDCITNQMLLDWMHEHDYPIDNVPNNFISMGDFDDTMQQAEQAVAKLLPDVNKTEREARPVSELKIALQCGGSDAFSGISGNPLAGAVAKRVIQRGGSANLSETDELTTSEDYLLRNIKTPELAKRFMKMAADFEANLNRFGHTGLSNPSGGNHLRGLINIFLKSKGAATKKDPELGIDHIINYAERMDGPGYYFMDGPGNDLESQAGQMAAGCNMVFFITGNGSITNFPITPTIKFITTTSQYEKVGSMDVNAGRYLDGEPMDKLADDTLDLAVRIASGGRSIGEKEGRAQLQIWRAEPKKDKSAASQVERPMRESGEPIEVVSSDTLPEMKFSGFKKGDGSIASQQIGLVIPTSLCAGEWAAEFAKGMERKPVIDGATIQKFSALPHTEGCGATNSTEHINTLLGYMSHPSVAHCQMLEHGCESVHAGRFIDVIKDDSIDFADIGHAMNAQGMQVDNFGWASIQKDGGLAKVAAKVRGWFKGRLEADKTLEAVDGSWKDVRLGLMSQGRVTEHEATDMAQMARNVVTGGGTVVIAEHDPLLQSEQFKTAVFGAGKEPSATLSYGQNVTKPGLHIMATSSTEWSETMTGLGATGVESIITYSEKYPRTSHPFIPVINVTTRGTSNDFDLTLDSSDAQQRQEALQAMLEKTLSREYTPKMTAVNNAVFQISRGAAVTL